MKQKLIQSISIAIIVKDIICLHWLWPMSEPVIDYMFIESTERIDDNIEIILFNICHHYFNSFVIIGIISETKRLGLKSK